MAHRFFMQKGDAFLTGKVILPERSSCRPLVAEKNLEPGQGQSGTVWRCQQEGASDFIVVKRFTVNIGDRDNKDLIDGLTSRFKVILEFDHPNVVTHYQLQQPVSTLYGPFQAPVNLVMEYVEGGNLGVAVEGPLDADRIRRWGGDVLRGLSYLHQHSIIHSDIKPDNLFLTSAVRRHADIKIGDLGDLKPFARTDSGTTESGKHLGTQKYQAPEILNCENKTKITLKSDMYSLGWVLIFMAWGKDPTFFRLTDTEKKIKVESIADYLVKENGHPHIPDRAPAQLKKLIEKCCFAHQEQRPSADELLEDVFFVQNLALEETDAPSGGKTEKGGVESAMWSAKETEKLKYADEESGDEEFGEKLAKKPKVAGNSVLN